MRKIVFVSGCFDMLNSGHILFLEQAAAFGDLYVGLGSDQTFKSLKGRAPVCGQAERKYMIEALKPVKRCFLNRGLGVMDFVAELKRLSPDIFVVNEDGNTPAKAELCHKLGIQYVVLNRRPPARLAARSTTRLWQECRIPYRLDLAGGWLDQPFVSQKGAGPVLTISLEPTIEFNERSGMASSSRRRAVELWQTDIPAGDREQLAKTLFAFENPPGTKQFSGSQDAIGIVYPNLNRLSFAGAHWPASIQSINDEKILRWLEKHLFLISLGPRGSKFDVLKNIKITPAKVRRLAEAANRCWEAIRKQDVAEFGSQVRASFEAQVSLFPGMMNESVRTTIQRFAGQVPGWKLSGAGGGGYLVLVSEQEIPKAIKIKIRRKSD